MSFHKAPNWKGPGDAPTGQWKIELLRYLGRVCDLGILIETGTCEGSTILGLIRDFIGIYSVEVSPHYHAIAKERLKHVTVDDCFLELKLGSSPEWLDSLLTTDSGPCLFWLDAHPSGHPSTVGMSDPLAAELAVITQRCLTSLIVIDDLQDAGLQHVREAGVNLDGWHAEYRCGVVLLYREGQFHIPEFA